MDVESIVEQACKRRGFKRQKPNSWTKEMPDAYLCVLASRNFSQKRLGLHHLSVMSCFKNYLTEPKNTPASNHFPVSLNMKSWLPETERQPYFDVLNDLQEIPEAERYSRLMAFLEKYLDRSIDIVSSRDRIRDANEVTPRFVSVMGPALELNGQVWDKPWPPVSAAETIRQAGRTRRG
ncbi:hypothetical protein [Frigidibacter sp. SD6-1]|uniref:hypothetical protein n=1 Tax=Frigidibacter sp. SD6-1 TaxID=3032581 RepID=UPI0024E007DA|nr:hypothetical protein [Frigidibacter sp. SD6-1]